MTTDLEKAKQLFWDYACSYFFMAHDGVLDEYKRLGGSSEYEAEWRREYLDCWTARLSVDDLTAVNRLWNARAHEALPRLIELAPSGDDYARLWYANAICELSEEAGVPQALRARAVAAAVRLWEGIIACPQGISAEHRLQIEPSRPAFNASTPEEYVRNYAEQKLERLGRR